LLLSIDTSAGTSASVFNDAELSFVSYEDPFGHAENIGDAIERALLDAQVRVDQLTAIAVARGPAPYTGLRVGMAAAAALAKARNIPLLGVVTLDAIAFGSDAEKLLVVTDAKRRELFAGVYSLGSRIRGPMLINPADLESFTDHEILEVSSDARKIAVFARQALTSGLDLSDLSALYLRSPDVTPSAGKKVSG
jgi:tRNA threonylcarbamoyl adenosine modification protein YeaZ